MNIKSLIASVIETIIKVVVLALAVMYILKGISKAYDFGYAVFADEPMTTGTGKTITIGIPEDADVDDVANMLESKGLIEDANLFKIQELLSSYHGEIKPGMYDLSTSMRASEILKIISTESDMETLHSQPVESEPVDDEEIMDDLGDFEELPLDEIVEEGEG